MMYTIFSDDELIYDPRSVDYTILQGELTLGLNQSGTLKIMLPPTNPSYGRIKLMKSIISVYENQQLIFRGRPYAPSVDLYRKDTIECEGELAYLNDSVQLPFSMETGDVRSLFEKIIQQHNATMPPEKQFLVGEVTVKNSTVEGNVTRGNGEYISTWKYLMEKVVKPLGGTLWIRYVDNKRYLDYLADLNHIGSQEITQTINVLSAKKETTSEELATVILPLGAKIKKEDSEEEEFLTLEKLTGSIFLKSEDGIKQYGEILKVVHHDHITKAENLLKAGGERFTDVVRSSNNYYHFCGRFIESRIHC